MAHPIQCESVIGAIASPIVDWVDFLLKKTGFVEKKCILVASVPPQWKILATRLRHVYILGIRHIGPRYDPITASSCLEGVTVHAIALTRTNDLYYAPTSGEM